MKFKYLGIIDDPNYEIGTLKEKNSYLIDKELYILSYTSKSKPKKDPKKLGVKSLFFELSEEKIDYIPSMEVRDEFYNFIKDKYKAALVYPSVMFDKEFSRETFGINSKSKIRSIALKKFNIIFEENCSSTYHSMKDRFYALSLNRETFKYKLAANRDMVEAYLLGNENFFNRSLYENSELLIDILNFEGYLQVLITLNREHEFQYDNYFTPKPLHLLLYEAIGPKVNIKQAKFIDSYISDITEKHHSYLTVLYRFLIDNLQLDIKEKTIRAAIMEVYDIKVGRFKRSDSSNLEYYNKFQKCEDNWSSFNSLED
ncbi:hypothetical protein [Winogradskyella helgolandensis]|uniref:hypothetical protein n=1 Tax=Winogradskyella helgolandensis TaxID=2697010 RepID=UPI0015CAC45B|nr:hypothetical protein [Winogradskyella helgolandensis]